MSEQTGRPRGRPKGALNKRTAEREAAMRETAAQITKAVEGAFEGDAYAYLTAIYKDPTKPENLRMDAAKAAIRYERAAFGPQEQVPKTDSIPLAERLRLLTRRDPIGDSAATVVELKKPGQR
jgi:hypothetical protein